jgi:myosin-5
MEAGADVWVRFESSEEAWVQGRIFSREQKSESLTEIVVTLSDTGGRLAYEISDHETNELADVKLRNDRSSWDIEDLIHLPHLHEPAILNSLNVRYDQGLIYTNTGPILIAVNPFKTLPLYSTSILEEYYSYGLLKSQGVEDGSTLSPHVFQIADNAYRDMMRLMRGDGFRKGSSASQTILISGESGAGKTESTKFVMRYLTTVGSSTGSSITEEGSIMDKVLQSNPILEALGNARTVRNDNSSRFGKFIELNFDRRGLLIGASIRTYLLEKVRLPFQAEGERNFHIFYQLTKMADEDMKAQLSLDHPSRFHFTNQGDIYDLRFMDDAHEYEKLRHAMRVLDFPDDKVEQALSCIAGIIHLGEVGFIEQDDGEASAVNPAQQPSFLKACELMGLDAGQFETAMTTRSIDTRGEIIVKKLKVDQADGAKDALAKMLYGRIFDWAVFTINQSIACDMNDVKAYIGVLDIFGFECFQRNSFEQLCINYTNETLQNQFNQFIFKMEQEEYEREGIQWSFISFPDNQECLDLIEARSTGILATLDDECKVRGNDEKFANRLYKGLKEHPRFKADFKQQRDLCFTVIHYAGEVPYDTTGFVEKNKDDLPLEAEALFRSASFDLVREIFTNSYAQEEEEEEKKDSSGDRGGGGGGARRKPTFKSIGSFFKLQLHSLMSKIHTTAPHYIRCLKPNDRNVSDCFVRNRINEQLKYGGVLEAVRVARSGFPVRLPHGDFYARYKPIAKPSHPIFKTLPIKLTPSQASDAAVSRQFCEKLIDALFEFTSEEKEGDEEKKEEAKEVDRSQLTKKEREILEWTEGTVDPQSVQLGISKVFLRTKAYDLLENRRHRRLIISAVKIQCVVRMYVYKAKYFELRDATWLLLRVARGMLGRKRARE